MEGFQTAYFESIAALTFVLNEVSEYVQQAVDTMAQSQKISQSLGRTFSLSNEELSPAIRSLDGTITQKLSVAFAGLEQGLKLNSDEVIKLATEQKILGENFKKTIALFTDLQKSFNFSTDQSNSLAKTLEKTSDSFGVSVEYLAESLESFLSKNKDILTVTDLTQPAAEAVTMLAGMFGPGSSNQKDIESFIGLLLSSGTSAIKEISTLGITQERRLLGTATTSEEFINILISALQKASNSVENTLNRVAKSGDVLTNTTITTEALFGNLAGPIRRLAPQLDQLTVSLDKSNKGIKDLDQVLREAFDPLNEAFLKVIELNLPYLMEFFDGIKSITTSIKNFVTNNIENLTLSKVATAGLVSAITAASIALYGLSVRAALKNRVSPDFIGPLLPGQNLSFMEALVTPLKGAGTAIITSIKTFLSAPLAALKTAFSAVAIPLLKFGAIAFAVGAILGGFIESIKSGLDLGPLFKGLKDVFSGVFKLFFTIGKFIGSVVSVIFQPVVFLLNKLGEALSGLVNFFTGDDETSTLQRAQDNLVEKNKLSILEEIATNTSNTNNSILEQNKTSISPLIPVNSQDTAERVALSFREQSLLEVADRLIDSSNRTITTVVEQLVESRLTGSTFVDKRQRDEKLDVLIDKLGGVATLLDGLNKRQLEQVLTSGRFVDAIEEVVKDKNLSDKNVVVEIKGELADKLSITATGYGGT